MNEKAPQRKSKRNNNHTATYLLCALTISIVIVIVLLTSVLSKNPEKENETPEHTVDTAFNRTPPPMPSPGEAAISDYQ